MKMMIKLARAYPGQTLVVLIALISGGIVQGIGLTAMLPLLQKVIDLSNPEIIASAAGSGIGDFINSALLSMGITPTIGSLLIVVMIGTILKSLLGLLVNRKVGYTVAHVATDLRLTLLRALLTTRWGYFLDQRVGSMANAAGTEVMRSAGAYSQAANVMALSVQTIAYFLVALLVSWKITLLYMTGGALIVLLLSSLVAKAKRAGRKQTRLLQSLLAHLADSLQSLKAFKSMGREDLTRELLSANTLKLNKTLRKQVLSKALMSGIQAPLTTLMVLIGLYVMLVPLHMDLPEGVLLIFLMSRILKQIGKVQRTYQDMVISESAYWSLQEKIVSAQKQKEPVGGDLKVSLSQGILFDRVHFGYTEKEILSNISLEIPCGTFTSIVGPSGAGKTTLVDLITGLFEPTQGTVLIDGIPLPELNLRSWRHMIGYVPQDPIMLHDTIFTNVTLGEPSRTSEDVEYALRAAGAWNFVAEMAKGVQAVVGERGAKLSGGQRQRIAIARALVHRPKLLILDEATSALDPETEASICQTLKGLRGQLTLLAISHQTALVEVADRVFKISEGGISQVSTSIALDEVEVDK
ncbi:MAG: ABC transporter ATP-binding protein [Deltaproteobacteria bacterium]|nr:ABC transporter ATP-binding protein [Deltaproteobacteria bacterium]